MLLIIEDGKFMYVQFFNSNLVVGEQSDSEVAEHIYDLLFELNCIESTVLLAVLPQLEFKLKVHTCFQIVLSVKWIYRVVILRRELKLLVCWLRCFQTVTLHLPAKMLPSGIAFLEGTHYHS